MRLHGKNDGRIQGNGNWTQINPVEFPLGNPIQQGKRRFSGFFGGMGLLEMAVGIRRNKRVN